MEIKTHSKLNLGLKVLGKRDDGYHEIKTIMSEFSWGDTLTIFSSEVDSFSTNMKSDGENLVVRALNKLREHVFVPSVSICLSKNTPIGSGMGTGSSDAAETLKGLNSFFKLGLSNAELCVIASEIGMDVPFFIDGGLQIASGRGEELRRIDGILKKVLIVMDRPVISKNIYSLLIEEDFDSDVSNTLILPVLRNFKRIRDFYNHIIDIDKNFKMTGAGGAFFLLGDEDYLKEIKEKVSAKYKYIADILIPEVDYANTIFNS